MRRRTPRRDEVGFNSEPNGPMSGNSLARKIETNQPYGFNQTPINLPAETPLATPIDRPTTPMTRYSPLYHIMASSPTASEVRASSTSTPPTGSVGGGSTQRPFSTDSDSHLTPEDAQFLHGLYSRNVPLEEIADMMKIMRAEREASNRAGGAGGRAANAEPGLLSGTAPPVYDFE